MRYLILFALVVCVALNSLGCREEPQPQKVIVAKKVVSEKKYPELSEIFELTIDGSNLDFQPRAMLRNTLNLSWKYEGKTLVGRQTRKFKLVAVEYHAGLWDEMTKRLSVYGKIPEGQWLMAFTAAYPRHDGKGFVGVDDASWVDPRGNTGFAYIARDSRAHVSWTAVEHDWLYGNWRWLVFADEVDR